MYFEGGQKFVDTNFNLLVSKPWRLVCCHCTLHSSGFRLFTSFWNMAAGVCSNWATRVLVMLGDKASLAFGIPVHPKPKIQHQLKGLVAAKLEANCLCLFTWCCWIKNSLIWNLGTNTSCESHPQKCTSDFVILMVSKVMPRVLALFMNYQRRSVFSPSIVHSPQLSVSTSWF